MNRATILQRAKEVLNIEARAIGSLVDRLDDNFVRAVELFHACRGKVVVTGLGKSGLICRKIAATLSSTGTPVRSAGRLAELLRGVLPRVAPLNLPSEMATHASQLYAKNVENLLRLIVSSNAYQLSSRYTAGKWEERYTTYYARHYPRRIFAESVIDAVVFRTITAPARFATLFEANEHLIMVA